MRLWTASQPCYWGAVVAVTDRNLKPCNLEELLPWSYCKMVSQIFNWWTTIDYILDPTEEPELFIYIATFLYLFLYLCCHKLGLKGIIIVVVIIVRPFMFYWMVYHLHRWSFIMTMAFVPCCRNLLGENLGPLSTIELEQLKRQLDSSLKRGPQR